MHYFSSGGEEDNQPGDSTPKTHSSNPSPHNSPKKEPKHGGDKVYNVATDKTIKSLMSEYKKRKQAHTMPTFVKQTRSKPLPPKKDKPRSDDPIDRQIEEQQKTSITKVRAVMDPLLSVSVLQ